MREFLNRKSIIYLIVAVLASVIVFAGLFIYIFYFTNSNTGPAKPTESEIEKALKTMGSSSGIQPIVPEDILDSLGGSNKKAPEVSGDILKSLGSTPK
jgi:hypothetical protein